jgi:hypothetical protein
LRGSADSIDGRAIARHKKIVREIIKARPSKRPCARRGRAGRDAARLSDKSRSSVKRTRAVPVRIIDSSLKCGGYGGNRAALHRADQQPSPRLNCLVVRSLQRVLSIYHGFIGESACAAPKVPVLPENTRYAHQRFVNPRDVRRSAFVRTAGAAPTERFWGCCCIPDPDD